MAAVITRREEIVMKEKEKPKKIKEKKRKQEPEPGNDRGPDRLKSVLSPGDFPS